MRLHNEVVNRMQILPAQQYPFITAGLRCYNKMVLHVHMDNQAAKFLLEMYYQ